MNNEFIILEGCKENNLKNVSLQIPKNKITVFTGVSGSGKSSVVFDTIAQEAGRQLNETFSNMVKSFLPRYSQPNADKIENISTAIVIDQKRVGGNARSTLGTITDINAILRLLFSRFAKPYIGYGNSFSFNTPEGMCAKCEGIGKIMAMDVEQALDKSKSLNEGAILLPGFAPGSIQWGGYTGSGFFDNDKKLCDYSKEEMDKLLYAKPEKILGMYMMKEIEVTYEGLAEKFIRQNLKTEKERSKQSQSKFEKFAKIQICPDCEGKRYNETALSSKISGYSIYEMTEMQIDDLIQVLSQFDDKAAEPVVENLLKRLRSLMDIGLDYVNLNRDTPTLSGGESQRVKMVKHLSSALSGMMYIFDEPSIGLHPRDVHRLNEMLVKLRDKGNTIIVVEHDPDVIKIADYVIDMGPGAGSKGGEVVYSGSYEGLASSGTLTAEFLTRKLPLKKNTRTANEFLESSKSSLHNLKDVSIKVPKGIFTVITGVAGSGKSTLVNEVFAKEFEEVIRIDQNPISINSRSNPATYTGVMDAIRKSFAEENNAGIGLFSYNSEGGCEKCKGTGTVEINLSFMDKMVLECDECGGKRFKKEVLGYQYKGRSIVDVMEMTIADALMFFEGKDIKRKLKYVNEVGLGYMTLGQPLNTLSGGECQRLKLAKELNKKGNIYILDEPTTGLHMSDITDILHIIDRLVDKGNTVIAIEHNLDIMKNADWIIDMGPYGGIRGGEILFEGKPEGILDCERSLTGRYLKKDLGE